VKSNSTKCLSGDQAHSGAFSITPNNHGGLFGVSKTNFY